MESKRSKYILIGLSVFCILLIGITSFKDGFLNPLRSGVGYVLNPIQSGVNRVGTSLYNGISNYSTLHSAMAEKQALQERIDALVEENSRLQSEQFELQRLRELYDLDQDYMQYQKIGARVIAKDSGDWFQVFRINKGSADGVLVDANVIAGGGLVGIVTDVGAHYATVRSIIYDVSRVSGMAQQSGNTCIVAGDLTLFEEGRLRISNVAQDADFKDGDRIVTSNISSKFLPGILIGYAADMTTDQKQRGHRLAHDTDLIKCGADAPGFYGTELCISADPVSYRNAEPASDPDLFLRIYLRKESRAAIWTVCGNFTGSVLQRSFWLLYAAVYQQSGMSCL